jgi:hypothetical protein
MTEKSYQFPGREKVLFISVEAESGYLPIVSVFQILSPERVQRLGRENDQSIQFTAEVME